MCRWSSQITSDYADCPLNPSRLVSPPPPPAPPPFLKACPYHRSLPGTWYTGVFQNNFLRQKLLAFNFAINPSCFSFPSLLLSCTFFATSFAEKMHPLFLPANDPLNELCQLFISKELNHPVKQTRLYPGFIRGKGDTALNNPVLWLIPLNSLTFKSNFQLFKFSHLLEVVVIRRRKIAGTDPETRYFILLSGISGELAGCVHWPIVDSEFTITGWVQTKH